MESVVSNGLKYLGKSVMDHIIFTISCITLLSFALSGLIQQFWIFLEHCHIALRIHILFKIWQQKNMIRQKLCTRSKLCYPWSNIVFQSPCHQNLEPKKLRTCLISTLRTNQDTYPQKSHSIHQWYPFVIQIYTGD